MQFIKYFILGWTIILCGCISSPQFPENSNTITGNNGAYILCEGLFGMDNSTLSRYDNQSNTVVNDYFALQNKGQRLGDTGNDIVRWNQHIFIPVTKSRTIEKIRINDGISDGRIKLSAGDEPQRIAILNDTVAYVTLLNDRIKQFNPTTLEIKNEYISVGPAPEGIAVTNATIFVANSGYGDLRKNEPKASTISVINRQTNQEIALLTNVINVRSLHITNQGRTLYAMYSNLNTPTGLKGGIVQYDIRTLQETNRWTFRSPSVPTFNTQEDSLFVADSAGVWLINLRTQQSQPQLLFPKPTNNDQWYHIQKNPNNNTLWISTYPQFSQKNGWVSVKDYKGQTLQTLNVLLTPRTILFF